MIINAGAMNRADAIPPTVLVATSPAIDTIVSLPVAVSSEKIIATGIISMNLKDVVIRFSFSG